MSDKLYQLFYIRRSIKFEELASIYLRVTVGRKRAEVSVQRKIARHLWNASAGRASGSTVEAQQINRYLNKVENKVYQCYQRLLDQNQPFTAKQLLELYTGKQEKFKMLLEVFYLQTDKCSRKTKNRFNNLPNKHFNIKPPLR